MTEQIYLNEVLRRKFILSSKTLVFLKCVSDI